MRAMKALSVNRMLGGMKLRGTSPRRASGADDQGSQDDTPEANAARSVRLFCESEGANNSDEEVLYLPVIVEAAESSPAAAKECAQIIRKYLSKDNTARPHVQYNSIMLVRILSDNPGPTFTRNIDKKFVDVVKELVKFGRDPSVRQILTETLQNFSTEKKHDENLHPLTEMWKKEQAKMAKIYGSNDVSPAPQALNAPPFDSQNQNYFSRSHHTNRPLPSPQELSSRIEEARTSAKLLTQVVQSTPPTEFLQNDLIREFADRCQSASRSIQGYIVSQNPAPDNDTMLTLIETNEQLALAMSKHQRAVLQTRKMLGYGSGLENGLELTGGRDESAGFVPPSGPPPNPIGAPKGPPSPALPPAGPPSRLKSHFLRRKTVPSNSSKLESGELSKLQTSGSPDIPPLEIPEDPFRDPTAGNSNPPFPRDSKPPIDQFNDTLGVEPYHPGFSPSQIYPPTHDIEKGEGGGVVRAEEDDYGAQAERKAKGPIYRY